MQSREKDLIFPIGKIEVKHVSPQEIGLAIRAARKTQGLRQDELAGAAGVGIRLIVDLEAGKPTAQTGKLVQVLDALGLSIVVTARRAT